MIPDQVERDHVVDAIQRIQRNGVPERRRARKYALLYEGEHYPPKYTLGVAAEEATGEYLDPQDDYGGGEETNRYLRKLGFTVVRKDRPDILASRAVLGLNASKGELKSEDGRIWDTAYQRLRSSYEDASHAYRERIERIASHAQAEDVDWLVLPACALAHSQEEGVEVYSNMFEGIPWVFAGTMSIPGGESAVVMRHGTILHQFDDTRPWALQTEEARVLTAISSTIGKCRDGTLEYVEERPVEDNGRIAAIDLGHNQYTGRYTKTMKSVVRHLEGDTDELSPLFILAYWRYQGGYRNYLWYEPRDASFVDTWSETLERDGTDDWLDYLHFTV